MRGNGVNIFTILLEYPIVWGRRKSFEASFDHHGIVCIPAASCARLGAGVLCDGEYLILFWWWWRRKNWEWSLATILYLLGHLNLIVCIQMWLPRPRRTPAASVHTQPITSHIVTRLEHGQNQERKDVYYVITMRKVEQEWIYSRMEWMGSRLKWILSDSKIRMFITYFVYRKFLSEGEG